MNRPDLNSLAKQVFEANKAKGFHDVEQSNETLLMLVITELSEAVEADRKGKRTQQEALLAFKDNDAMFMTSAFDFMIKDTLEDELADAVIRLLDLAGLRGIEININEVDVSLSEYCSDGENFTQSIYHISRTIVMYLDPSNAKIGNIISLSISEIEGLCSYLSIDLWQHVELKLKYNETRPMMHGKLY